MDQEQGKESWGPEAAVPASADDRTATASRGRSPGTDESLADGFARIDASVAGGRNDLGRLGFWRLLERLKRDPTLADRWADEAGRIDRTVFERRVRLRFPTRLGNAALLAGTGVGAAGIVVSLRADDPTVAGIGLLVAAGAWSVSVHGLAHFAVGWARGIRFTDYFFKPGELPPRPGIKTDYATYLRATPSARASMHASGAIATKLAPFVALAFYPASNAPPWAAWLVVALGIGQIATDVLFSAKTGDWSKVTRERAFARRPGS
jgi:hypothetical protein